MAFYTKKPVTIEAVQWTGENIDEIQSFVPKEVLNIAWCADDTEDCTHSVFINTLEGEHCATVGDYIIKGVKGEFYPCKPDIFEMTYDKND